MRLGMTLEARRVETPPVLQHTNGRQSALSAILRSIVRVPSIVRHIRMARLGSHRFELESSWDESMGRRKEPI